MNWTPGTNNHFIFSKDEWACLLNAVDVLEKVVTDQPIDHHDLGVLDDLKASFPPALIEQTRAKLS